MKQWVRIRSWHLTSAPNRHDKDALRKVGAGMIKARCGKWADAGAPQADERPQGKTCESCLRIQVGR